MSLFWILVCLPLDLPAHRYSSQHYHTILKFFHLMFTFKSKQKSSFQHAPPRAPQHTHTVILFLLSGSGSDFYGILPSPEGPMLTFIQKHLLGLLQMQLLRWAGEIPVLVRATPLTGGSLCFPSLVAGFPQVLSFSPLHHPHPPPHRQHLTLM